MVYHQFKLVLRLYAYVLSKKPIYVPLYVLEEYTILLLNLGVIVFMWVSPRITAVVPAAPSIHVPAVHTASSDVGIELPAAWQQYQSTDQVTPSFWHHGTHPSSTTFYGPSYPIPPTQIFYHFPSIYFQNFYGTFNI